MKHVAMINKHSINSVHYNH